MKITCEDVENLTEEAAKKLLSTIIFKLDELDNDDMFGSEGWRKFILGED